MTLGATKRLGLSGRTTMRRWGKENLYPPRPCRSLSLQAHACLYVVDSSTQERLAEAAEALAEVYQDDRMKGKPLLM